MPANFPTADQKRYYGRYVEEPTSEQLGQYFHLTDTDRALIYSRTREHTQLGIAVQIGTVRFTGEGFARSLAAHQLLWSVCVHRNASGY